MPDPLPIDAVLPELAAAFRAAPNLVLQAPTGAGKTTRVAPFLLDQGLAGQGRVLLLEPRRLAARAAARRMAQENQVPLGRDIGYHVRFDRCADRDTRLLVVTPGILLRYLQDDPFLEGTTLVLFDEFHERGLESDLALGLVRLLQTTVRPDLKIAAMSATLATDAVATYLGSCPVVSSPGRSFPVDIEYRPKALAQPWPEAAAQAVEHLVRRTPGDILVFLPGMQEMRRVARLLEEASDERNLVVVLLHGDLPLEQQDAALLPQPRKKVILATNVAETSITVEGVAAVVDTGLARVLRFDPDVGLDRLEVEPVSQASTDQRAGRAGRTQPGVCIRLWSEAYQRSRPEHTDPEIRRVDLAGAVLHLLAHGEHEPERFPWLEAPDADRLESSFLLLHRLGAIEDRQVTPLGKLLARLPVHPRLGRLLLEGRKRGCPEQAALAAALLSERDPFSRAPEARPPRGRRPIPSLSDVLDRVEALEDFARSGTTHTPWGQLLRGPADFILRTADQLLHHLRDLPSEAVTDAPPDHPLLPALLAAFPDRVARRRMQGSPRGRMVGGRGVKLADSSGVVQPELFLCIDVDGKGEESTVRLASALQRDWLEVRSEIETTFDPKTQRIAARKRVLYEDLLLEESTAALPEDEDRIVALIVEAARGALDQVLPPPDSPAGAFLTRARWLAEQMPELGLPAFDQDFLESLLPHVFRGRRSFAEARAADWLGLLQGSLTHQQLQALERDAPDKLEVPSGSRIALQYEAGKRPILAVRIQEVFGLKETPRLAGGRVPVLLHLLAPNHRPQQVTDDLASFWANIYPVVRKELRARYPKHAWPEDPLTAEARSRPGKR